MSQEVRLALLGLGAFGCSERPASDTAGTAAREAPSPPSDSLAATMPGGHQIWFTLARVDSGAAGPCTSRAVEIRHEGRRLPVPLLYTSTPPEPVSDTTFRARLSDHCVPGDRYLVDLRTGRPVRER